MPLVRDRCICLRKVEFSETSQILHLLSQEHGIVRLIAKGAHRRTKAGHSKFDGGVDLLDVGEAVFTHDVSKDLCILTEWSLREGQLALRSDLRAVHLGTYGVELTGELLEQHDPVPQIFYRLEQTLTDLASPRREEAFLAFELDLLRDTGFLPELAGCVMCGRVIAEREPQVFFSASQGGVVCRDCEPTIKDRLPIDLRLLRMVQNLLKLPRANGSIQRLPRLTRAQTDPLNLLLAEHVEQMLGKRMRLPRWILKPAR